MPAFRADCGKCCGLCCVVPHQLASQGFPSDKPANTPCHHLNAGNACSIHALRAEYGYQACGSYDCFGAGQWVNQELFGGAGWKDSPELADQMFAAFRHWTPRFEAAALLEAALPYVRPGNRRLVAERIQALTSAGSSVRDSTSVDAGRLKRETLSLIRSLF